MNTKDTFKIICSFIGPLELNIFRKLSKHCNIWTDEFIYSRFKKINIEEYICPKCGDFIDQSDISNYNDFNDYFLSDENKILRLQKIDKWFNSRYIFDVERKNILCDSCEIIEDYDDNFYLNFRYKGVRQYNLFLSQYDLHNWAALCIIYNDERGYVKGYWNEYRKPLSCTIEEFSQDTWNTWDNEDNEDNEDNDEYEYYNEYEDYNYNNYIEGNY